jgi:DMSO reductase family type II enzyme heme b subunit
MYTKLPHFCSSPGDLLLAVLSAMLLAVPGWAAQAQRPVDTSVEAVSLGRKLFSVQCAYCHGPEGKGDGEISDILFPKPRDLTSGEFRLRSTPKGTPPLDSDLLKTITRGIPGSAMPGFPFLSDSERSFLVQYIKTLSSRFAIPESRRKPPFDIAGQPAPSPESISSGKQVYERLQCASCHGAEGKGDGPAVKTLQDDSGFPIAPRNFTAGPYKGGASVADIFLRISSGMEGTPMTSYGQLSQSERWQLAYYVRSLCKSPACADDRGSGPPVIMSARVRAAVPNNDPFSASWSAAPQTNIPLISLWNRGSQAPALTVRSLNDGKTIAFLLEWSDSTRDTTTVRPQDFRDSVALQLFAGPGNAPIAMGDRDSEVTIWQWKADWQAQIDAGRKIGVQDAHPFMIERQYPQPGAAALEAGNPIAPIQRSSPVEEATARGFGTITPKPLSQQLVTGKGVWRDGRWHVALSRKLASGSSIDAATETNKISFAIWNGSEAQRNGEKAISNWNTLVLGRK